MALIRKRRLTEQQQRRIEKQHKTRQEEVDTSQRSRWAGCTALWTST